MRPFGARAPDDFFEHYALLQPNVIHSCRKCREQDPSPVHIRIHARTFRLYERFQIGYRLIRVIVFSPINGASQEVVVGLAQRIVVTRALSSRDAAVHNFLEYLGFQYSGFELEGSAQLVVQFKGEHPETAPPHVAYVPVDFDRQVRILQTFPACELKSWVYFYT